MVLRPEAILERISKLEEVISRLESLRVMERDTFKGDFRNMWLALIGR